MALTQTANLKARLLLAVSDSAAFIDTDYDKAFTFDISSEEVFSNRQYIDGVVTDQAVSLGGVTSPSFIFVKFNSRYNGDNSTTEDAHAPVTVKIDGGSAFKTDYVLLGTLDPTNDTITSTISFTTIADTDTQVDVLVVGQKS